MKLVVRAAAAVELGEAFRWYETQREGLGDELLRAVETVFEDLLEDPERHPKIHRDIRRALVRRFPYAVSYRVLENRIVVVAVFHGRRDPTVWRRRRRVPRLARTADCGLRSRSKIRQLLEATLAP